VMLATHRQYAAFARQFSACLSTSSSFAVAIVHDARCEALRLLAETI
jgi:hypothetical protein